MWLKYGGIKHTIIKLTEPYLAWLKWLSKIVKRMNLLKKEKVEKIAKLKYLFGTIAQKRIIDNLEGLLKIKDTHLILRKLKNELSRNKKNSLLKFQ